MYIMASGIRCKSLCKSLTHSLLFLCISVYSNVNYILKIQTKLDFRTKPLLKTRDMIEYTCSKEKCVMKCRINIFCYQIPLPFFFSL